MRRRDREMSEAFGLGIIDKSRYGVLSMVDRDGKPFGLPLSIARDGHCMYFHSAQAAAKWRYCRKILRFPWFCG